MRRLEEEDMQALIKGGHENPKGRSLCTLLVTSAMILVLTGLILCMTVLIVLCYVELSSRNIVPVNNTIIESENERQKVMEDDMGNVKMSLARIIAKLDEMKPPSTGPPLTTTHQEQTTQPQPTTVITEQSTRNPISTGPDAETNLWDTIHGMPELSTFAGKLSEAGLDTRLTREGPFAVFAPNNDAFKNVPAYYDISAVDVVDLMEFHIAKGDVWKRNFSSKFNEHLQKTLLGKRDIRFNVYVNPSGDIVYTANGRKVVDFDHLAYNGEIHIIDSVMASLYKRKHGNLETQLELKPKLFSKLLHFLNTTNVTATLKTQGPFTLFAPTDSAFAALPSTTMQKMVADVVFARNVLYYHLVNSTYYSPGMYNNMYLRTVQGSSITVTLNGSQVKLSGGASITEKDWTANNGCWHVIDKVMIPS